MGIVSYVNPNIGNMGMSEKGDSGSTWSNSPGKNETATRMTTDSLHHERSAAYKFGARLLQ